MNARNKLNLAYFNGFLLLAVLAGIGFQSWIAFFTVLVIGIVVGLCVGHIRPGQ